MTAISPVSGVQLSETISQVTGSSTTVEKDEFLKLLITQLQHQDPLEPMDNAEFVSQVTQFSALEQLISIREAVETSAEYLGDNSEYEEPAAG